MKKVVLSILTVFILILSVTAVCVSADNTFDIDIDVKIRENGDATVTQKWYGSFYEGTENYLPIGNFADGMDITDFKVWDKNGEYEFIDDWDIDWSREEKERKCGIIETDNGYELCYGIGEYGENEYWFSYDIIGLVGAYNDKDGFNFQFVNTQMNCYPTDVNIHITSEDGKKFNDTNCDIYAFGFDGQILFDKEGITAFTDYPLESGDEYVNIVTSFEKGVLNPERQGEEKSYEELLQNAKEGSSYGNNAKDNTLIFIVLALIALITVSVLVAIISYTLYIHGKTKKFVKEADYFRDAPCCGNIETAYFIAKKYKQTKQESSIIGAVILKLMNSGCLEPIYENKVGFMGREKKTVNLKMCRPPEKPGTPESRLYNVLYKAAGEDGVLQEKELKKYCENHPEKLRDYINVSKENGEINVEKNGKISANIYKSSEYAQLQLKEVAGLKKYLLDYSLIAERGIEENAIWEDYLVYATLFGIADKVMEQFKKVYPEQLPELEQYNNTIWLANSYGMITYHAMTQGEFSRSGGSGGSSSFGGGGGFSGGGVGGGSR